VDTTGYIKKTHGDMAVVEVRRVTACGGKCSSCEGCKPTGIQVEVENTLNAKPGQMVKLRMASKKIVGATLLVYFVPMVMLFIGALLGGEIAETAGYTQAIDLFRLAFGLMFMGIFYIVLKRFDKKIKENKYFKFKMEKII